MEAISNHLAARGALHAGFVVRRAELVANQAD